MVRDDTGIDEQEQDQYGPYREKTSTPLRLGVCRRENTPND